MLDGGKAAIFVSYAGKYATQVAIPIRERLRARYDVRAILVGEEPLPPGVDSNPSNKVDWYLNHCDMAVFLATPDDVTEDGEVRTRQNITEEHARAQSLPHLKHKLLMFKAPNVVLPSNINPAYEPLPVDDPDWVVSKIVSQARVWQVMPAEADPVPPQSPQSSSDQTDAGGPASNDGLPGDADEPATAQAFAALQAVAGQLNGTTAAHREFIRAELAIAALSAGSDAEVLGVHLANRVFMYREQFKLTPKERRLLLRSYLQHTRDQNVPSMAWLRDLTRHETEDLILSLARDDGDDAVRAEALRILARLARPTSVDETRELLLSFVASSENSLRQAGFDYLLTRNDPRLRELLDDPVLIDLDPDRIAVVAALLDVRRHPTRVLERYASDAAVRDDEVGRALLTVAPRINRAAVLKTTRNPVPAVRRLGLELAQTKGCLAVAQAELLLEAESSPALRLAIIRALMAGGADVTLEMFDRATAKRDGDSGDSPTFSANREVEASLVAKLSRDELEGQLTWYSMRGPALYEAIGHLDAAWASKHVRRDLRTDFARLPQRYRQDLIEPAITRAQLQFADNFDGAMRATVIAQIDEKLAEFADFHKLLLNLFRRSALRVLCARSQRSDAQFARRFITDEDHDVRVEALRLLERTGTANDAAAAVEVIDTLYDDDMRRRAAALALRLSYKKNKLNVLDALREKRGVSVWAVHQLAQFEQCLPLMWALLEDQRPHVRLAAADVVWTFADSQEAGDGALSYYMGQGHYYYNVVRAIDRRLYAPAWLSGAISPSAETV